MAGAEDYATMTDPVMQHLAAPGDKPPDPARLFNNKFVIGMV
jgi:hypothetical protein